VEIDYGAGTVNAVERGAPGAVGVLLAHGAGAGQRHPWMVAMAEGLADRGLYVLTFDYRYTEAGRRSPDRMPTLLDVHRAAADAIAMRTDRVVLAGKSMGGRAASHLAGDQGWPAAGLVYYGYPLMSRGEPRPVEHLERIDAPQLFFTGSKDTLGPSALIEQIAAGVPDGEVVVIEDGDHSFKVPKRTGRSNDEVLQQIAADTAAWIERSVAG
jgi:uncharacterized protein